VVFAGVIVVIAKKPTLQGSELVSFSQMVRGSASLWIDNHLETNRFLLAGWLS
jgi:hypothetical protein